MRSIKSVKGFKNDKRNLLEATDNLIVFGEGQTSEEITRGRRRSRILHRGPSLGARSSKASSTSRSRTRTSQALVPGPGSAMKRLDTLTRNDVMSNFFLATKPWKQPSLRGSTELTERERESILQHGGDPPPPLPSNAASNHPSSFQLQPTLVNVHVCPVCSKGFEPNSSKYVPASDIMRHSMANYQQKSCVTFRKNLEDGWGSMTKPKFTVKPQQIVVSSNCGELFHKICLRDWCSLNHKVSPRTNKPSTNCPSCTKELKYTNCQEIETIRNFSYEPTATERELTQTKLVNKELQVLWPESSTYLTKLQLDIMDAETLHKELKSKKRKVKAELKKLTAEDLSVVMSKVADPDTVKAMLEKQEKALEFMQQETLQIMRMYLLTVVRKSNSSNVSNGDLCNGNSIPAPGLSSLNAKIPSVLSPHIQSILNDDHSLHLLSRIIAPMPDEAGDHAKLKLLEYEILQKFDPSNTNKLTRTDTYTVFSSVAEVGETESEVGCTDNDTDCLVVKELSTPQITTATDDDEKNLSLVKEAAGMHAIPAEKLSRDMLILRPKVPSQVRLPMAKPSKLLRIREITSDNEVVTITSSAGIMKEDGSRKQVEEEVEEDKEESPQEVEYTSPLARFAQSLSIAPVEWLFKAPQPPSSMEVRAQSFSSASASASQRSDSAQQDSNYDNEREEEEALQITRQATYDKLEPSGSDTHPVQCLVKEEDELSSEKMSEVHVDKVDPKSKLKEVPDDLSWSTISTDEEKEEQPTPTTQTSCAQPASSLNSSCELVFSAKERKRSKAKRQITLCHGHVPVHSTDISRTSVPEKQVSIAIMYIIDDDESGSELGESEMYSKQAITQSEASTGKAVVTPVHIDAQKTSNYSVIVGRNSNTSSSDSATMMQMDLNTKKPVIECDDPISTISPAPSPTLNHHSEKYRPPTVTSWPNGLRPEVKVSRGTSVFQNSNNLYYLQPSLPNVGRTRMFFENEIAIKRPDKVVNGNRIVL